MLRQRGFARVRMRDDGKAAASRGFESRRSWAGILVGTHGGRVSRCRRAAQWFGSMASRVPFLARDFPDFGKVAAGDIVALDGRHDAHAGDDGDFPGPLVRARLWNVQNRFSENIEPVIGDGGARFGHVSLALPGRIEPEAPVVAR